MANLPTAAVRKFVDHRQAAGVADTIAMKMTGHKTRSVFDRYDITSEEDLAEAARKLQTLAGTISGTNAATDAEALKARLAKTVDAKGLWCGPPGDRTRDTVIKSHVLYH
jgi:hypothetical protein